MINDSDRIYVRFKGRVLGPLTPEKTKELIRRGQITKHHELSPDNVEWFPAVKFGDYFQAALPPKNQSAAADRVLDELALSGPVEQIEWHANLDDGQKGPVAEQVLRDWIATGRATKETLVWRTGMGDWDALGTIRPDWFAAKSAGNHGSSELDPTSGQNHVQDLKKIAAAMRKSHPWVQFLAITGIVLSSIATIAAAASFFVISTSSIAGPAKAVQVLVTIFNVASSVAWLVGSIKLLRFSNRLSALSFRSELEDISAALEALSSFWRYSGIVVAIWLIVVMIIVTIFFIVGVSITSSIPL